MDDKIKSYAETLYMQSLMTSVQTVLDDQVALLKKIATQTRSSDLPFSGSQLRELVKFRVKHIERCMQAKLDSYQKAYQEAVAVPTNEELIEIWNEVEQTQKLQISQTTSALQVFLKGRSVDWNPGETLATESGHGHDEVLQRWKIWRGKVQLQRADATKPKLGDSDDYKFARLAVDEARKSVSEQDGRPHPKVGAVVVKNGQVLSAAYRGEFEGNHAEYIALEKHLSDTAAAGATVYTTLEPCTTRNHPKIPCAQRLIERKVARVVIGMLDPDHRISGKGQRKLRTANIVTDFFPPNLMTEVEELNREFTRYAEQQNQETQRAASSDGKLTDRKRHINVFAGVGCELVKKVPKPDAHINEAFRWTKEVKDWAASVHSFLKQECGALAANKFERINRLDSTYLGIHKDVGQVYGSLQCLIRNLEEILEKASTYLCD